MPRPPAYLIPSRALVVAMLGCIAVVAAGWLLIGLPLSGPSRLTVLEQANWPDGRAHPSVTAASLVPAPALFAVSTGANATPEAQVVLHGIAKGPRDQAALLSIGEGASAWLNLGQSRDGVTLVSIEPSKVTVDTALGFRTISLDKPSLSQAGHRS